MNPRHDRVLGRGLSALISGADAGPGGTLLGDREARMVPLVQIGLNPDQPRKLFRDDTLQELAASIRQVGVLQPVLVRRRGPDDPEPLTIDERTGRSANGRENLPIDYILVAGERRLRAAAIAGLSEIPALVCTLEETEALRIALLENIQRDDLNPVEEALAYRQLLDAYGATQEELAAMLGKSRSGVANTLRLLSLEQEILDMLERGEISRGHAKALVGLENPEARLRIARLCRRRRLSVRECEERVRAHLAGTGSGGNKRRRRRTAAATEETREVRALRERAEAVVGSPVTIERSPEGKGTLGIRFYSDEDLLRILALLGVDTDLG